MAYNFPRILIRYNRFLDPIFIEYCKLQPKWKDWVPPAKEVVLKRVDAYEESWKKEEEKILQGLYDVSGLGFQRNIIDIHIVSGNPRQFSNPIVIKSGYEQRDFVDTLTHELIHVLLTDNRINKRYTVDPQYQEEPLTVKNHILLHAFLKAIFLDILGDSSRLDANLKRSQSHSTNEYSRAWDIVEKEGYKEIIARFRAAIDGLSPEERSSAS